MGGNLSQYDEQTRDLGLEDDSPLDTPLALENFQGRAGQMYDEQK